MIREGRRAEVRGEREQKRDLYLMFKGGNS